MNSFIIADPNKCIGCRTCQIACVIAHSDEDIFNPDCKNISFNPRLTVVKTATVSAPIQCRHCEDAPCANVCPNGSISNINGSIQINEETCIGCKTCLIACPLGAIELVDYYKDGEKVVQPNLIDMDSKTLCFKERIIANKCDLCINRENGPACVEVCPTDAFKIVKDEDIKQSVKEKRNKSASLL